MSEETDLYRYYDANSQLLYVGISLSTLARATQHRSSSGWWTLIARMERTVYANRRIALQAEREAIKTENPIYNIIHTENTRTLRDLSLFDTYCKSICRDDRPEGDFAADWLADADRPSGITAFNTYEDIITAKNVGVSDVARSVFREFRRHCSLWKPSGQPRKDYKARVLRKIHANKDLLQVATDGMQFPDIKSTEAWRTHLNYVDAVHIRIDRKSNFTHWCRVFKKSDRGKEYSGQDMRKFLEFRARSFVLRYLDVKPHPHRPTHWAQVYSWMYDHWPFPETDLNAGRIAWILYRNEAGPSTVPHKVFTPEPGYAEWQQQQRISGGSLTP